MSRIYLSELVPNAEDSTKSQVKKKKKSKLPRATEACNDVATVSTISKESTNESKSKKRKLKDSDNESKISTIKKTAPIKQTDDGFKIMSELDLPEDDSDISDAFESDEEDCASDGTDLSSAQQCTENKISAAVLSNKLNKSKEVSKVTGTNLDKKSISKNSDSLKVNKIKASSRIVAEILQGGSQPKQCKVDNILESKSNGEKTTKLSKRKRGKRVKTEGNKK